MRQIHASLAREFEYQRLSLLPGSPHTGSGGELREDETLP